MDTDIVPVTLGAFPPWRTRRPVAPVTPDPSRIPEEPLVSCLCVTENRHAFMPWLLWGYDRQRWARRELVIVDSSDPPAELPERDDVRVIRTPLGSSLGHKRNVALEAARGDVVAWFDDDDWQHPERLSRLVPLLRTCAETLGASFVGPSHSWFLSIDGTGCEPYRMKDYAIFNGSVFYTELVRQQRFPEDLLQTEDTHWLSGLIRTRVGAAIAASHPVVFFWLAHDANVTNRRRTRALAGDPMSLRRAVGSAWADTPRQLAELRARLAERPATRPARVLWAEAERVQADARAPATPSERSAPEPPRSVSTAPTVTAPCPERYAPGPVERHRIAVSRDAPRVSPGTTISGRKLLVYAIGSLDRCPGFVPYRSAGTRHAEIDAILEIAIRRRKEWQESAYAGFVKHALLDRGIDFDRLAQGLERLGFRHDVYGYLDGPRRSAYDLLAARHPLAPRVAEHVLVRRMRLSPGLLRRNVTALSDMARLARPELFARVAQRWLIPVRARLGDRLDPELQALLAEDPAGTGVIANAIFECALALFEAQHDLRLGILELPRSRQHTGQNGSQQP